MPTVSPKRFLNVDEFAERTGKRPATIRQKIWRREQEHLKIGRNIRFTEEMVEKALENSYVPAIAR
ncbi:hypothetical protein ACPOL_3464 [Acidisarcina polymorpha]|uniref:Uncharacterized protein n=1 Tax=Acidisarcina polymorpha TaxID=2211140 RepID=A0A2Z5G131_9BACT|nr:helix-turn-helix domain-containing protein [Acidisarcina polymorpha]AXC12749.1 hypothetical protein ACPOL_3464 [Acidisarcina polymorpha]